MILRRLFVLPVMIVAIGLSGWADGGALAAPAASPAPAAGTSALSPDQATAAVGARGYTATGTGGYDQNNDLSVIVGRRTGAVDGHPQLAFLFHRGNLVGTDTQLPSATVEWLWSTRDVVALSYQLYRPDDPLCCPSAGAATVRYRWNGTKIVSLDSAPAASWSASASRRAVGGPGA